MMTIRFARTITILVFAWCAFILTFFAAGCQERSPSNPNASRSYSTEEWQTKVLQSKEPVLVDFWAPWCDPCLKMHPTIEGLAKDYTVIQVDVDKNSEIASRYGASSIPLLLIFKDGNEVARHVGVTSESKLREEMEKYSKK